MRYWNIKDSVFIVIRRFCPLCEEENVLQRIEGEFWTCKKCDRDFIFSRMNGRLYAMDGSCEGTIIECNGKLKKEV